ncbi:Hypothetical predicted protein [Mytilus galloprovincialis]|uniref:Farnesoic acid O-methyl transferase domain-containing protein n=1 Tax=Mytilus galloprovincialis TaxID=29158 RepID=A0A8B6FJL7_MYTGA|nr:Hypothetical predicted protein [Mytilus galloprovincialis]
MLFLVSDCNTLQLSTLNAGNKSAQNTPHVYKYYTKLSYFGVSRVSGTFMKFQVKSCRSALVLLSVASDLMSPDFYEIFYGGGGPTWTYVTRKDWDEAKFNTRDIFDCNNMLSLWLSWEYGQLKGGTGSILGQEIMFEWNDLFPLTIKGIGVMSAYGQNATWIMSSAGVQDNGTFCGSARQSLTNTGVTTYGHSLFSCAITCIFNVCAGFDYNSKLQKCHIVDEKEFLESANDIDSVMFTKCLYI